MLFARWRERSSKRILLREKHYWYQCALSPNAPRHPLPEGFRLIRASFEDLSVTETFGWVNRADAEERHRDGASLWLLFDDEDCPAFCCWTFTDAVPLLTIERRSLLLREGTAAVENSFTAKKHRGNHFGAAALSQIVGRLADEGVHHLVTKIQDDNRVARKAALGFGFREVAVMQTSRLLWFRPKLEIEAMNRGQWPFRDERPQRKSRDRDHHAHGRRGTLRPSFSGVDLSHFSR